MFERMGKHGELHLGLHPSDDRLSGELPQWDGSHFGPPMQDGVGGGAVGGVSANRMAILRKANELPLLHHEQIGHGGPDQGHHMRSGGHPKTPEHARAGSGQGGQRRVEPFLREDEKEWVWGGGWVAMCRSMCLN